MEIDIKAELKVLGEYVRSKGWEPILTIVSEHGGKLRTENHWYGKPGIDRVCAVQKKPVICYHIYAAIWNEKKEKDRCALFRFSDDPSVIGDEFIEFPSFEEGNNHFLRTRLFVSMLRNIEIKMDEFEKEAS